MYYTSTRAHYVAVCRSAFTLRGSTFLSAWLLDPIWRFAAERLVPASVAPQDPAPRDARTGEKTGGLVVW